jgi:hypothetical protein
MYIHLLGASCGVCRDPRVVRPLPWRDHLKDINSSGSVSDQCGMGIWESQYFVSDLSAKMGDENRTVNNRALAHYGGLVHQSAYLLLRRFEGFDCFSPSPQESRGSLHLSWIGLQIKLGCHPHALSRLVRAVSTSFSTIFFRISPFFTGCLRWMSVLRGTTTKLSRISFPQCVRVSIFPHNTVSGIVCRDVLVVL